VARNVDNVAGRDGDGVGFLVAMDRAVWALEPLRARPGHPEDPVAVAAAGSRAGRRNASRRHQGGDDRGERGDAGHGQAHAVETVLVGVA